MRFWSISVVSCHIGKFGSSFVGSIYRIFLGQIRSGSIFSDVQLCTIWPDISALFSDQYDFPDLCFDWLEYVKQPIISSL